MKVCITKVSDIIGKDKREWTKISFVTMTGETGSALFPKGDFVVTPDQYQLDYQTSVDFDQRGRVVSDG